MSASSFEAPLDTPADWAVLADWLTERGDPRGEWLQLEQHLAQLDEGPVRKRLRARLVGEFQPIGIQHVEQLQRELGQGPTQWIDATWRCGLLIRARVSPGLDAIESLVARTITTLLDSNAARVLGDLHLGDAPTLACHEGLLGGPVRPGLHALTLGDFRGAVGRLAPLADRLPNVRTLELRGRGILLADARLARLHSLSLQCEGEFEEPLRVIGEGGFAKLRMLHLRLGGRGYASLEDPRAELEPLLSGRATPQLDHFGLTAIEFADAMIAALAESTLLRRLTSLDLSDSWLRADGADILLARADAFEHLQRFDVAACHIPEDREAALVHRFGERVHVGHQVRGRSWDPETRAFDSSEAR